MSETFDAVIQFWKWLGDNSGPLQSIEILFLIMVPVAIRYVIQRVRHRKLRKLRMKPVAGHLVISISSRDGSPIRGAEVVIFRSDGTAKKCTSELDGRAVLDVPSQQLAEVFVANPGFEAHSQMFYNGDVPEVIDVVLEASCDGGSTIIDGTGEVPGLDGKLEIFKDAQGRQLMYAGNMSTQGSSVQPFQFMLHRPILLSDSNGSVCELTILKVISRVSLVQYRTTDRDWNTGELSAPGRLARSSSHMG